MNADTLYMCPRDGCGRCSIGPHIMLQHIQGCIDSRVVAMCANPRCMETFLGGRYIDTVDHMCHRDALCIQEGYSDGPWGIARTTDGYSSSSSSSSSSSGDTSTSSPSSSDGERDMDDRKECDNTNSVFTCFEPECSRCTGSPRRHLDAFYVYSG